MWYGHAPGTQGADAAAVTVDGGNPGDVEQVFAQPDDFYDLGGYGDLAGTGATDVQS